MLVKALVGYDPNVVDSFYSDMCFDDQWAMAAVIPFILLYNGERGKNIAIHQVYVLCDLSGTFVAAYDCEIHDLVLKKLKNMQPSNDFLRLL